MPEHFFNRAFVESDTYPAIHREIAYRSSPIWLYTVEIVKDINREGIDTGKRFIRMATWRGLNDKENKKVKLWKQASGYNIRSQNEWNVASSIVDSIYGNGKSPGLQPRLMDQVYDQLEKAQETNKRLKSYIEKLKDVNSTYVVENEAYRARYRVIQHNIREYNKTLKTFKETYDHDGATETEVHDFIEENKAFWLFGLEYTDMLSREPIPLVKGHYKDIEFDLLLKRQDLFWDMVELKGPDVNLFDKRTSLRHKPNQNLSEALGQVITYMDICDTSLREIYSLFKPKAIIVIGRKDKDVARVRRLFSSYLNNIEIITYTDLYERGKALLEYISGIKTKA